MPAYQNIRTRSHSPKKYVVHTTRSAAMGGNHLSLLGAFSPAFEQCFTSVLIITDVDGVELFLRVSEYLTAITPPLT